jgi:hypothetical protein
MSAKELVQRAEQIYEDRLKAELEKTHKDYFVAIEPASGDYFLGRTLSEASAAAHAKHPDRRSGVLRVGHRVGVQIGAGQA